MNTPLILISNDDGISSPGLKALAEAMLPLGELIIAAPSRQQSATGRALRGNPQSTLIPMDFKIGDTEVEAYHCDCTPAQIVLHAFNTIFRDRQPDLVVSGINYGENVGINVTQSGTLGAAMEGAARFIPSLAISVQTKIEHHFHYGDIDWDGAAYFSHYFAGKLLSRKMPRDVDVLKIEVPFNASESTPWRITRQSRQPYYVTEVPNGNANSRFKDTVLEISIDEQSLEADSDIQAVALDQVVAVTPLSLDLTSRTSLDNLDTIFRK